MARDSARSADRRQQRIGESAPMMACITEGILQPQRTAQIKLRIALPGKSEAAMKLHRAIACKHKAVAGFDLGHAQGDITATDQQYSLHARDSCFAPP